MLGGQLSDEETDALRAGSSREEMGGTGTHAKHEPSSKLLARLCCWVNTGSSRARTRPTPTRP